MDDLRWQRPEACGDGASCPEVAMADDMVYVRSSLHPSAIAQLTITEWHDLVAGIQNGEFNA
ncbi:hypothetical protein GCM10009639_38330 [Kitasatospora putterlickiae]|uniref:DUF397 domain-containing protein n=1 Tax=Kitasatospora putterlickiae TaxID=221725 RepID=A0ABN1Y688_9ACTN